MVPRPEQAGEQAGLSSSGLVAVAERVGQKERVSALPAVSRWLGHTSFPWEASAHSGCPLRDVQARSSL